MTPEIACSCFIREICEIRGHSSHFRVTPISKESDLTTDYTDFTDGERRGFKRVWNHTARAERRALPSRDTTLWLWSRLLVIELFQLRADDHLAVGRPRVVPEI